MQTVRSFFVLLLVFILMAPGRAFAAQQHIVSPNAIATATADHASARTPTALQSVPRSRNRKFARPPPGSASTSSDLTPLSTRFREQISSEPHRPRARSTISWLVAPRT